MTTLFAAAVAVQSALADARGRIDAVDARALLCAVLGRDAAYLIAHGEDVLTAKQALTYESWVARREAGEPVAYITGLREFYGRAFTVTPDVLIPRPETELLVDAAVAEIAARLTGGPRPRGAPVLRIADVGTGSGAIALALLAALRRRGMADQVLVIATDASDGALDLARENAVGHGLADRMVFVAADLLPPVVDPPYAIVCANLPYVASGEIDGLGRELAYEPRSALDGGPDGLDLVRRLLDRLPDALAGDGVALLEIGADQGGTVVEAVHEQLPGWRCAIHVDLAGLPRVARVERGA